MARLLVIMGSGETTPTMAKTHRHVFERLGPGPLPAVLLDTPYAFQTNAAEISARATAYFRESARQQVEVVSLGPRLAGTPGEAGNSPSPLVLETALAKVAEAKWIFAGPGSPSYALEQWKATVVPKLLQEQLSEDGCLVFSSAAALTLGRWTVPVYEIYKVGAPPVWLDGLDLISTMGLDAAVIPHYDNAEGGTHDTRYCYLGEERLETMESQLPVGAWILGVDEHTALLVDFDAGLATVAGLGSVTVRRDGLSATIAAGRTVPIESLAEMAASLTRRRDPKAGAEIDEIAEIAETASAPEREAGPGQTSRLARLPGGLADPEGGGVLEAGEGGALAAAAGSALPTGEGGALEAGEGGALEAGEDGPLEAGEGGVTGGAVGDWKPRESPLMRDVRRLSTAFDEATANRDAARATEAVLELEETLHAWSADTFQSDEVDRSRAALRRMVVRLGELAQFGLVDPRESLKPWVEGLLEERAAAREQRRFADADRLRDRLIRLGVEVRDGATGTEWLLDEGRATLGSPRAGYRTAAEDT